LKERGDLHPNPFGLSRLAPVSNCNLLLQWSYPYKSSPSPHKSTSDSSCMQRWSCLFAWWTEREGVGKDEGIRDSAVSSRATCCLLGVLCRCLQPVYTPSLPKYSLWSCYRSIWCAAVSQRDIYSEWL